MQDRYDRDNEIVLPSEPRERSRHRYPKPRKPGEKWISIGTAALLIFLTVFAIYQCARHLTVGMNTLRTQEITDTTYIDLELYVLRDERIIGAESGNVFRYDVRNGERISANTLLGQAYTVMDADAVPALQKQLNEYSDRLARLRRTLNNATPTDADTAYGQLEAGYRGALNAALQGRVDSMTGYAADMLAAADAYRSLTHSGSHPTADAGALAQAQAALTDTLNPGGSFGTNRSGWFLYGTDGYEYCFPYGEALTMSPARFREMTGAPRQEAGFGAAGRMVYTDVWYAAALLTVEEADSFHVGRDYTLSDGNADLTLTCVRVEADGAGAMVVFSSQDMPEGSDHARRLCGQVAVSRLTGYRIPSSALVVLSSPATGEPVTGVYILEGNRVAFRRVMTVSEGDGYTVARTWRDTQTLLATLDADKQQSVADDGWAFLQMNDLVITRGRNLYEGKTVG